MPLAGYRILYCSPCGAGFIGMRNSRLKGSCGVLCVQTASDVRMCGRVRGREKILRDHWMRLRVKTPGYWRCQNQGTTAKKSSRQNQVGSRERQNFPCSLESRWFYHSPQILNTELQDLVLFPLGYGLALVIPYDVLIPPFWNGGVDSIVA